MLDVVGANDWTWRLEEFHGTTVPSAGVNSLELENRLDGGGSVLRSAQWPEVRSYLRFEVTGVTGLYGFVSDDLDGEWEPLNRSGLVLANPVEEPFQAYSWLVLDDLSVSSFVDAHGLDGRLPGEVEAEGRGREHFGGTMAPPVSLQVDGSSAGPAPGL